MPPERRGTVEASSFVFSLQRVAGLLAVGLYVFASAHGQEQTGMTISTAIDVRPQDLLAAPPSANWTSYNGDYSGRRFSALAEITPQNVSALRAQWIFHVRGASDLEVTPVVVDGVMFLTAANDAFAVDARTGRAIWNYCRPVTEGLVDDTAMHQKPM